MAFGLTTSRPTCSTGRCVRSRIGRAALCTLLLLAASVAMARVSSGMPLYVLQPTYSTLTLDVEPSDTIENVKAKLQDSAGFAIESQYLYFGGTLLEDGRTLGDYSIGGVRRSRWWRRRLLRPPRCRTQRGALASTT